MFKCGAFNIGIALLSALCAIHTTDDLAFAGTAVFATGNLIGGIHLAYAAACEMAEGRGK